MGPGITAGAAALLVALAWPAPRARAADPEDRFPAAAAAYLVAVGGEELWAKGADAPRAPASLTKIMTALLALEQGGDPQAWVRVGPRAARATGSRLGLRGGESARAGDLLAAALVSSANDACLALAEHLGGSAEAFVARMNARARALGLGATTFQNPCGHDAPGHRSSARDLLRLTRAALALPGFRDAVARERVRVVTRGGRAIEAASGNALLGRLAGARGVKSGFTPGAGKCLVALAERGGVEVLLVLLDAPERWWVAAAMVEAAFEEAGRRG